MQLGQGDVTSQGWWQQCWWVTVLSGGWWKKPSCFISWMKLVLEGVEEEG